jgi:hypothetical protein
MLGQHIDRSFYELDHRFEELAEPTLFSIRQIIAYWRTCEAKGGLRMGRDIPARAIAPLLSQIMVYEPFANWEDAHVRYAGFGTAKYFGRDVTGLLYSEMAAGDRSGTLMPLFTDSRRLIAENRYRVLDHRALNDGIEVSRQELVTFPIFGPDGTSRWLLGAAFDL